MAGYLDQYGAGDERRAAIIKRTIFIVVGAIVFTVLPWYIFKNHSHERRVKDFLELIRKKTEEYGCIFILDEVKTGFRMANGGAQEYYNIKPDLATYAKALGNGYPIAIVARADPLPAGISHNK